MRAIPLFDKIIVAVGNNTSKKYLFSVEERLLWLKKTFKDVASVEVHQYNGLTIEYCKTVGASFILRGLRNPIDYNYENTIAQMNRALNNSIETIFMPTDPIYAAISSTTVRDIIMGNGDAGQFLPDQIKNDFKKPTV